jgi:hypothetical protein
MKKINLLFLLIVIPVFLANAQDSIVPAKKNKWHFLIEPYLMFPNMNGTAGIGNLPDASFNSDPGDIFSHLQIGGMLYFEAHNNNWAITTDLLYMKLTQDVPANQVIISGNAKVSEFLWELTGFYKIVSWFEVGAGARLYSIHPEMEMNYKTGLKSDTTRSESLTKTWVDPIIATRFKFFTKTKWIAEVRGDIGGFGIGSKFAWQVQADAGYKFVKWFQATIGYRYIDVNYEKGSGSDRFLYDVATFGPTLRFGFTF